LETGQLFFLGYSNGANMLLSLLFSYPTFITHLVLLHSMLPFEVTRGSLDLSKHAFFLSIGEYDQIIPPSKQYELIEVLQSFKAVLTVKEYQHGHEITQNELTDVVSFLKEF
jgi:phospholipase/carboxylesterase